MTNVTLLPVIQNFKTFHYKESLIHFFMTKQTCQSRECMFLELFDIN